MRRLALLLVLVATNAVAHESGVSESELDVLENGVVHGRIAIPALELSALAPVDRDGDGRITQAEVDAERPHFERLAAGLLDLRGDGEPCPATLQRLVVGDQNDGLDLFVDYACNSYPARVEVQALLLAALPLSHRHGLLLRAGERTTRAALGGPERRAEILTPFARSTTTAWLVLAALASLLVYAVVRKRS